MNKDIVELAKRVKEKHREKINADLRDRIRSEVKDTLAYIDRQQAKGKADKKIFEDLSKSKL